MHDWKSFWLNPLASDKYNHYLTWVGHAFFLIFILFSVVFYQERLINFDSSYYTFHLLTKGDFYVVHGRQISYISQILPLLAIKAGAGLKTVMLLYSVSFMLFYYACFLILRYFFKNPAAGIFLALALCLAFRYKYYTAISEITASLGLLALCIGWLSKDWVNVKMPSIANAAQESSFQSRLMRLGFMNPRYWLIGLGLCILLVYAGHKFTLIPLMIYFGYEFFLNHQWKNPAFWCLIIVFWVALATSFVLVKSGSYEDTELSRLDDAWYILTHLEEYRVWEVFKDYLNQEFTLSAIAFAAGLGYLMYTKRYRTVLYFAFATAATTGIALVHNSYLNGEVKFMVDGYFGYLGVVWALFFYLYFLKKYSNRITLLLTCMLLLYGIHHIYEKHDFFEQRLDYYQSIIDANARPTSRKFILHKRYFSWDKMWLPNTMAYESLLYSAIAHPDSSVHIAVGYNDESVKRNLNRTKSLISAGKIEDLPEQFFHFNSEGYVELTELPWND